MVAVRVRSCEEVSPHNSESHARQAFRTSVHSVADQAHAILHTQRPLWIDVHQRPSREAYPLMLTKYGRFWAVYAAGVLVCVCVYKRGAAEVIRRLTQVVHGRAAQ